MFIVPLHVLLLRFVEVVAVDGGKSEVDFALEVGGDEVVRFAEDFLEAEWELFGIGCDSGSGWRKLLALGRVLV